MKKGAKQNRIPRTEMQLLEGIGLIKDHPFLGKLLDFSADYAMSSKMPKDAAVCVKNGSEILLNRHADYSPEQWAFAIAHAMLHRAFGHFDLEKVPGHVVTEKSGKERKIPDFDIDLWNTACDIYVNSFLEDIHFGKRLRETGALPVPKSKMNDELSIYEYLKEEKWPLDDHSQGTYTQHGRDMIGLEKPIEYDPGAYYWSRRQHNFYADIFAKALTNSVERAVGYAAGYADLGEENKSSAKRAISWFMNHYPLFGGMAAGFRVIEDPELCRRYEIKIAAVDAEEGELYLNPVSGLNEAEWKFVIAHEFLHVGLEHQKRGLGKDPYLWNVACDYVINGWLNEMELGRMPEGVLYDPEFRDASAEEIYDLIIKEMRTYRKKDTLRGYGKGDMIGSGERMSDRARGVSLDDFFKGALMSGLEYHLERGRGTIPAGLVQEIRALAMPPIRWDVKLANWFDEHIIPKEKLRTYAHPSRRQSATPDIPRPRYVLSEQSKMSQTFGVVIDTSGSMSAEDIGKALGAIASYAASKDVPAARVVFCDASAYDAGYLETDEIAGRVKVIGRGGTKLQPGVDLLEKAKDFPKEGPILLITDGWIEDRMEIRREHAFLIPKGNSLPFRPKGQVFYFE